ncbi:MAG: hypothetical protein DI537_14510 [Stutzerimonas stutzeri]|nr:MAG: hypothetical protein DI537_14510 [Stutzerimonas stutzeri]
MKKVRITGAVAHATGVTFYLEDGEELVLRSDSPQTKAIMDQAAAALARHETVEIDLDTYSVERVIEKKTKGLIKFFTTSVKKLFGAEPKTEHEAVLIGMLDKTARQTGASLPETISSAVVKTAKGDVVVPNVQRLQRQMDHAAKTGNTIGFQRFMERIASVIDTRKHSVDELLNFMSRGDLPIADDGSIVAYKILQTRDDHFVDSHSKKVRQKLGSHVSMPVDYVDDNRRTQCSTGLHIARRGYLRSFPGDVITLVKVAPEDVIAVPFNEPDKMRAAGYHIVAVLPKNVHEDLRANRPMTSDGVAAKMLADVIAGNHVGILERVVIKGAYGSELEITPTGLAQPEIKSSGKTAIALDDEKASISVKDVRKEIVKAVTEKAAVPVKVPPAVTPYVPLPTTNELKAGAKPVPMSDHQKAALDKTFKDGEARAKKSAAKVTKTEPTKKSPKQVTTNASAKDLPANHQLALKMRKDGKSNRAIEAELHICRKTLKKLFDQHG